MKRCINCNKDISTFNKRAKYCSIKCRQNHKNKINNREAYHKQRKMYEYSYMKEFIDKCEYCMEDLKIKNLDHIIPYTKIGNSNLKENLAVICQRCNSSKGTKDLLVWSKLNNIKLKNFIILRYQNIKKLTGA